MDMSNPKVRKLYQSAKDRAFDWKYHRLENEIDQLERAKPQSHAGARQMEFTLQAYKDALSERDDPSEVDPRMYPEAVTHDTPSLANTHGHGPVPPK